MWIARNKNNSLWSFPEKPIRMENEWWSFKNFGTEESIELHSGILEYLGVNLKWSDEPIKIGIL